MTAVCTRSEENRRALELLSREHSAMTPREVIEVGADDETDVLEAHPIDALDGRTRLYSADRKALGPLRPVLEQMWNEKLDRLVSLIEKETM